MKLSHHPVTVTLARPFATSRGVITDVAQHIIILDWNGLAGHGSTLALDDPAVLDDCAPLLADASPFALRRTTEALTATGIPPRVLAAVDMALHDLLGKAAGLPLHRLLGLAGLPLAPTALTVGACPDDELAARGKELAHWPILKLKMTAHDDGSRAGVLRRVYSGRIRVDGNGSWTPDQAVTVARELDRHGVELLEQPVAPGDPDGLRYVHEHSPVPIVADEDCAAPGDVLRLRGHVSAVNIKLNKCGGLLAARDMITLARYAGLKVMLGCKTESALGVTAMSHLGGLADYLDLDGHVDLVDDPFTGTRVETGRVVLPGTPGLGATRCETTREKN